jgi:YD repeat-containing protein
VKLNTHSKRVTSAIAIASLLGPMSMVSCGSGDDGPVEPDLEHTADPPPPPPTTDGIAALVGSTTPVLLPGSGGVTDQGTATYSIPLSIPKGPTGMQPELSLSYTGSAAANGPFGVGFTLTGLSTITPCHTIYAIDGHTDGPDFGGGEMSDGFTDAYCLDGQRLIEHGRTPDNEQVFHTQIESYDHVVAKASVDGVQPSAFLVYDRNGGVRTYEPVIARRFTNANATSTPTELGQPIAVLYRLHDSTDSHGNKISYVYETADLLPSEAVPAGTPPKVIAQRLKQIDYAFDDAGAPTRRIALSYTRRNDELIEYRWGVKLALRSVCNLISIQVLEGGSPTGGTPPAMVTAWKYMLTYGPSPDTGRSRITAVKMQESFGVDSWIRSFEWTSAISPTPVISHAVPALPPEAPLLHSDDRFDAEAMGRDADSLHDRFLHNLNWVEPNDTRLILFDVDGDGDDDALYRTRRSGLEFHRLGAQWWEKVVAGTLRMRLSHEGEPLTQDVFDVGERFEPGLRATDEVDDGFPVQYGAYTSSRDYDFVNLGKSRVADVNGDGLLDLVLARTHVDEGMMWNDPEDLDDAYLTDRQYRQKWTYGFRTLFGYGDNGYLGEPYENAADDVDTVIKGAVWHSDITAGSLSWLPAYAAPPAQRILADMDGDGRLDTIDPLYVTPGDPIPDTRVEAYRYLLTENLVFGQAPYRSILSTDAPASPGDPPVAPGSFPAIPGQGSSHGYPWVCGNGLAMSTEIDGDGRGDILVAGTPSTVEGGESDPVIAGDVYRRLSVGDAYPGSAHGNGFRTTTSALWIGTCHGETADLAMGDWNGDGLVDALYPPGSIQQLEGGVMVPNSYPVVRWNLGTGFGPAQPMLVNGGAPIQGLMRQPAPIGALGYEVRWDRGTRVADVDGDGRSDIVAFREDLDECVYPYVEDEPTSTIDDPVCTNKLVVFRSRGDAFYGEELHSVDHGFANLAHGFTTHQIGDVTGDGAIDAVMLEHEELKVVELPWRVQPDLVKEVRDSSVAVPLETFTYGRNWWGDGPRAEGGSSQWRAPECRWPIACPTAGALVVTRHAVYAGTTWAGVALHRNDYHRYREPRIDLAGHGSLGFGVHEIWERETGAWTRRTFDNDRFAGLPGDRYTFATSNLPTEILRVVPTYAMAADAVLQASGIEGGLSEMLYPAVITWTRHTYDVTPDPANPSILRVENTRTTTTEIDRTARLSLDTFPHYTVPSETGAGSKTTTQRTFDDYGNQDSEVTAIGDGYGGPVVVQREMQARYRNSTMADDGDAWLLGLPEWMITRSYTPGAAGAVPGRVARFEIDDHTGDVTEVVTAINVNATCFDPACETIYYTTSYTYDARGNLETTTVTDGTQERMTSTGWDALGIFPISTTDELGITTQIRLHPWFGAPTSVTGLNGITELTDYDGFGRVRSMTHTGQPTMTRSYSLVSGKLRVDTGLTDGTKSYEQYDDLGRVGVAAHRGFDTHLWIYTDTSYDIVGNVVKVMLPSYVLGSGINETATFDRLGRALTRTTPDHDGGGVDRTTRFSHLLLSTRTTDPAGHASVVTRDPAGRVIGSQTTVGGDAKGELTFGYGPFDRVTSVTDALGNVTTIDWSPTLRRLSRRDPDTGLTRSYYNGFGELRRTVDADGNAIEHVYDVAGRITQTTSPEGTTTRTYDTATYGMGQPATSVGPNAIGDVSNAYAYDSLGRLKTFGQAFDGIVRLFQYRYDDRGRVRYTFYPAVSGHHRFVVRNDYGDDGYLHELTDVSSCDVSPTATTELACPTAERIWRVDDREANGRIAKASYGPHSLPFEAKYGSTGLTTKVKRNGVQTDYTYDADGLLATRSDPAVTETFAHDEMHRLTDWTLGKTAAPAGSTPLGFKYRYDEIGNLLERKKDGVVDFSATFGAGGRPHGIAQTTLPAVSDFTYDASGRQLTAGNRGIDYNSYDLPATVTKPTTTRVYGYDADGQRAVRISNPSSSFTRSQVIYVGRGYELRDPTIGTDTHVFFVYGDDQLVAQVQYAGAAETTQYAMGDHLGTPVMLSETGTPEPQRFDPFGNRIDTGGVLIADDTASTNRGFTGHEEESIDGTINMRGRIYDPRQYRFVTRIR